MRRFVWLALFTLTLLLRLSTAEAAGTDARQVDVAHSTMTVHVYKRGFFSAFAHNHEIELAAIVGGKIE